MTKKKHISHSRVCVIAITQTGTDLAIKLGKKIKADMYIKKEFVLNYNCDNLYHIENNFMNFIGDLFRGYDALIFIMACGIVVRAIAPHVKDKKTDPAVLVMDEKGKFVISLLSGHIGGANDMAEKISSIIGGTPVITTATDVNSTISFDVFAMRNNCIIENMEDLKYISSDLVNNKKVLLYSDYDLKGDMPDNLIKLENLDELSTGPSVIISNRTNIKSKSPLYIRPLNLLVGIGCKKGILKEDIEKAFIDFMKKNERCIASVKAIATIELKRSEPGLVEFCKEYGFPLEIVSIDKIREVEENYTPSEFVKEKTGVLSVAEPCAVLGDKNTRLICKKTVYSGITLALSEVEMEFDI